MKKSVVEVPQFLRYKLKIHGLTGRQYLLLLAGIGGDAEIWQRFAATHLSPTLISVIIIVALVTLLVAFLHVRGKPVEEWLVIVLVWCLLPERLQGRKFRQAFLRVKQVEEENGLVELERGGGYIALIECSSEMQDIEGLTEFLNGLSFPVLLHLRMRVQTFGGEQIAPDTDLSSSLRRLQAHYLSYLSSLIYARPLRLLRCYVLVSSNKRERCLEYVNAVQSGLTKQAQLSCCVLLADEARAFYHESFGVAGKVGGSQPEEPVSARIAARSVCFETATTHLYRAALVVSRLPATIHVGMLTRMIEQEEEPYDFLLSIEPANDQQMVNQLQRKAALFGGAVLVAEQQGRRKRNSITQYALKEVEQLREELILRRNHLFATTLMVCVQATSRTKLTGRLKEIQQRLRNLDIEAWPLHFQHHLALLSLYGRSVLAPSHAHVLPTKAVGALHPFVNIPRWGNGVLLGATQQKDLVSFDFAAKMNRNLAVLGIPGAGKSFFLKILSARLAFQQHAWISVIDIEGEYTRWAEAVGARQTRFSADALPINPFALSSQPSLREKASFIVGLVALLVGEQGVLTSHERALVVEATMQSYASHGLTDDSTTYLSTTVPTMQEFLKQLRELVYFAREKCTSFYWKRVPRDPMTKIVFNRKVYQFLLETCAIPYTEMP